MPDLEQMTYRELAELNLIDKQGLRIFTLTKRYEELIKEGLKAREAEELLTKFEKIQDNETALKYFFIRMEFEELKKEMGSVQAIKYIADSHFKGYDLIRRVVYNQV